MLIAGAGIGGLTAALARLRRGLDVDIYEQTCDVGERGAGVQIRGPRLNMSNASGSRRRRRRYDWLFDDDATRLPLA
ncbi:MAG: NAD(P)-binding protein [Hyphomicrobiaceae bacterium]|nr:NAD(P)-binding protein [Hyphomicrobiaceae bacterium]